MSPVNDLAVILREVHLAQGTDELDHLVQTGGTGKDQ